MYRIHVRSSLCCSVHLCCVLFFLTLPTYVINTSQLANQANIDTHKNSEYASQKLNDVLENKKRRVRRQLQSSLQLQLAQALQQNPQLAHQLQQNPELLANLREKLVELNGQRHIQRQRQPRIRGRCNGLRKQNKLLRQMLLSVTDENAHADEPDYADPFQFRNDPNYEDPLQFEESQIHLSKKLSPVEVLLNQAQRLPSASIKSSLVTPSATWSTIYSTTSYDTTFIHTESTEVPIFFRGNRIITTLYNKETLSVTATEIKTSSTLITPTPTWQTETIKISASPLPSPQHIFFHNPLVDDFSEFEEEFQTSPLPSPQQNFFHNPVVDDFPEYEEEFRTFPVTSSQDNLFDIPVDEQFPEFEEEFRTSPLPSPQDNLFHIPVDEEFPEFEEEFRTSSLSSPQENLFNIPEDEEDLWTTVYSTKIFSSTSTNAKMRSTHITPTSNWQTKSTKITASPASSSQNAFIV